MKQQLVVLPKTGSSVLKAMTCLLKSSNGRQSVVGYDAFIMQDKEEPYSQIFRIARIIERCYVYSNIYAAEHTRLFNKRKYLWYDLLTGIYLFNLVRAWNGSHSHIYSEQKSKLSKTLYLNTQMHETIALNEMLEKVNNCFGGIQKVSTVSCESVNKITKVRRMLILD